jgi:Flp pilus assembly protein TadB
MGEPLRMRPSKQSPPPSASHKYEQPSPAEEAAEVASVAELTVGGALRAVEVAAAVLLALLICPPLAILVVVIVVPLVLTVVLVALVAAVLATPYFLVRHLRGHRTPHVALFAQRLRHAAHALVELLPHRIHRAAQAERHG